MRFIWYTVLIRAIPEAIGTVLLTLAVIKERRDVKSVLLVSSLCGLVAFTMRMLPLKFGIHALITLVIQTFIMNIVFKIKVQKIFKGLLVSLITLTLVELGGMLCMEYILKLDPQDVYSGPVTTIIAGLPSIVILYLMSFAVYRYNNRVKGIYNDINQ